MIITGRNPRLIIIDAPAGNMRSYQRHLVAELLDALAASEGPRLPPANFNALELRLLAHTEPPRWMFEQAPDPRKKPKGPRNRWGGLKS